LKGERLGVLIKISIKSRYFLPPGGDPALAGVGDYSFYKVFFIFAPSKLSRGVIGNTSDSGSEEFRFET
jgi:hypothetical protein